jgi:vancomycin permeability regulator SanA
VSTLRRHPLLFALLAVVAAVAVVLAVTGIAVWRAAHEDGASRIDHADVILVLGAAEYSGRPSPVFAGRLKHAALLFRQGRADTVMVLGGSQPGDVTTEAEAGRDFLVEAGLPPAAVVADAAGVTTFESLRSAAHLMRDRGMSSAFLVSDPWHNLRIVRMASDLGLDAHASATWQSAARSERTRVPGYLRETLAYLYYRLFGS